MALRMTITEDRDVVIVALAARIDSFAIEELYEGFEQVKKTGKRNIVLMMRDLEYINSRGIATLISFFKWAKEEGKSVKLAQVPQNIMHLLSLLGIEKLTPIYDTLPEAIEAFEQNLVQAPMSDDAATLKDAAPRGKGSAPKHKSGIPLVLGGAALVLLVLLVLFLLQGEKKGPEVDLQPLLKKIGLLEKRTAELETRAKEAPQFQEKLDSLTRNLNERLSHLEKDINQIKEDAASAKKRTEVSQPAPSTATAPPPKSPAKPGAARIHTVAPGENLFRIALRYNLSVEELRRLNNLRPNQSLQVGQKLNVGPSH